MPSLKPFLNRRLTDFRWSIRPVPLREEDNVGRRSRARREEEMTMVRDTFLAGWLCHSRGLSSLSLETPVVASQLGGGVATLGALCVHGLVSSFQRSQQFPTFPSLISRLATASRLPMLLPHSLPLYLLGLVHHSRCFCLWNDLSPHLLQRVWDFECRLPLKQRSDSTPFPVCPSIPLTRRVYPVIITSAASDEVGKTLSAREKEKTFRQLSIHSSINIFSLTYFRLQQHLSVSLSQHSLRHDALAHHFGSIYSSFS